MSTTDQIICISCRHIFPIDKAAAQDGVICPACGLGFMPDLKRIVMPLPEPVPVSAPAFTLLKNSVREAAKTTHVFALFFMLLGAAVLVIGFFASVQADKPDHSFVPWGLSFLGLAFWLELLAQIIYIRAAVEETARK